MGVRTSVLIPCYNAGTTIAATIESVMAQSCPADEIIVLLDGCTDNTEGRVQPFQHRVRLLKQPNKGVACARNRLVAEAQGDVLAFVDADDLWHPRYLEVQCGLLERHRDAVASFTGHVRFHSKDYVWEDAADATLGPSELLDPVTFFTRYNVTTAVFGSMSYCCVIKDAIDRLGSEPFSRDLCAVEDSFLCYQLALLGPVVFNPVPLVAYRLASGSLSENRVRNLARWTIAFQRLEQRYRSHESRPLRRAFSFFYASKRREYAKVLMGLGRFQEARVQLWQSLQHCWAVESILKSLGLVALGTLPRRLQPAWPPAVRRVEAPRRH